jgi:hypothetical protein
MVVDGNIQRCGPRLLSTRLPRGIFNSRCSPRSSRASDLLSAGAMASFGARQGLHFLYRMPIGCDRRHGVEVVDRVARRARHVLVRVQVCAAKRDSNPFSAALNIGRKSPKVHYAGYKP